MSHSCKYLTSQEIGSWQLLAASGVSGIFTTSHPAPKQVSGDRHPPTRILIVATRDPKAQPVSTTYILVRAGPGRGRGRGRAGRTTQQQSIFISGEAEAVMDCAAKLESLIQAHLEGEHDQASRNKPIRMYFFFELPSARLIVPTPNIRRNSKHSIPQVPKPSNVGSIFFS